MKLRVSIFVLVLLMLASCRFEHKVVEETWDDGSPRRVCIYKGKGEGRELIRETTYYASQVRQMEGTYKNNKRDGLWTYWYENGNMWSQGMYLNGKSDGKRTTFFENGKVRYEGFYKQDMRVGKWRFFDENGRLLQEVDYSAPPKETKPAE